MVKAILRVEHLNGFCMSPLPLQQLTHRQRFLSEVDVFTGAQESFGSCINLRFVLRRGCFNTLVD
jgi:hypothetical protein